MHAVGARSCPYPETHVEMMRMQMRRMVTVAVILAFHWATPAGASAGPTRS